MNQHAHALTIDGIIIPVIPDPDHEYTLTTAEVAAGYGVSNAVVQKHKQRHEDELIEGKHWVWTNCPTLGGTQKAVCWTKRGVVRLGFFIKSARAKRFRDLAEDLVIRELSQPQLHGDFVQEMLKTQAVLSTAIADLGKCFNRLHDVIDLRLARMEQRLTRLEAPRPPSPSPAPAPARALLPTSAPAQNHAEQSLNSDMLRLVAHLKQIVENRGSRSHDLTDITFTAREIITTAAKLQCFPAILKGRFLANGSFDASPSAKSRVGKLLSQHYRKCGFILDDGRPVFLCHSRRGRGRRYYLFASN